MSIFNKDIYYNLSFLKKNTNDIKYSKNDSVFVCIFQIIDTTPVNIIYKPYLTYLLYKYPIGTNEHLIFPFDTIKKSNPISTANNLVKKIVDADTNYKGFLSFNNKHFFFYQMVEQVNPIKLIKRSQQLWWAIIDEICNKKSLLSFPIADICSTLFFKHPKLIYLKDDKKENIEIPISTFYGGPAEIIPFAASVGIRANASTRYGSYYYTKSYSGVMRNAIFTSNYKERNIFSKIISNKDGKYFQGAIIRIATFTGNDRHVLYRETDPFYDFIKQDDEIDSYKKEKENTEINKKNKGKWAKKYDSLVFSKIKLKNFSGYFNKHPFYVIKSQKQLISLSYHLIDMKSTTPVWNPYYDNYKIK